MISKHPTTKKMNRNKKTDFIFQSKRIIGYD